MRGTEFNHNWKFHKIEEKPSTHTSIKSWDYREAIERHGLHMSQYDDSSWSKVVLPHDWSILEPYDKEEGEGCTGYLLGGIGWYRKLFVTTKEMKENKTFVLFDGIYNRSNIYCNGQLVTFHPYGYSPCLIDLTDYLNKEGKENILAIRVDRTRYADSRWYTGAGIYRNVTLHVLPPCYIPVWGVSIKTYDERKEFARVVVDTAVNNTKTQAVEVVVKHVIKDYQGINVCTSEKKWRIAELQEVNIHSEMVINNPIFWEIHEGKQYTVESVLYVNGEIVQENTEKFGIRTIVFDAQKGFFFNGKNILIKGLCLHHDGGCVGAAVPKAVWRRRLKKLVAGGCNAIRTAHNPFSEEFLDLCDELGILVQEEFYDEWDNPKDKRYNENEKFVDYITRGHHEFFREYAEQDLKNVVRRDINHPSIFQWSIGNEIEWTYPQYNAASGFFDKDVEVNYFWSGPIFTKEELCQNMRNTPELGGYQIGKTARKLVKWTKELDKTRPVIANCIMPCVSYEDGYIDALDIAGYSHRNRMYEYGHENYPDKPLMGTENAGQWYQWKEVVEKEYIPGIFMWIGVDHIGEAGESWPIKGCGAGFLDFAGFERPSYYMFKSLWTEEPSVYMTTQVLERTNYVIDACGNPYEEDENAWQMRFSNGSDMNSHWNYECNDKVVVEVYSCCESVVLYLNGRLVSIKNLCDFPDHIYKWAVPYEAGEIKAVGLENGIVVAECFMDTASTFADLKIEIDCETTTSNVDDAIHVEVQLRDSKGIDITHEEQELEFLIEGDYQLLGIDNGNPANVESHQALSLQTYRGKCLLVLRAKGIGDIKIRVRSNDIVSEEKVVICCE